MIRKDYKKVYVFALVLLNLICLFSAKKVYASEVIKRNITEINLDIKASKDLNLKSGYAVILLEEDSTYNLCSLLLAKKYKAPIFFANENTISNEVILEMKSKEIDKVFIIGKEDSKENRLDLDTYNNVEKKLKINNILYERVYGKNEENISLKIAKLFGQVVEDLSSKVERVLIANKNDKELIAAAAFVASMNNMPILLIDKYEITKEVEEYINNNKIKEAYTLSDTFLNFNMQFIVSNSKLIKGKNIYEINRSIFDEFNHKINRDIKDTDIQKLYIANINKMKDIIIGSELAQFQNSIVVLTDNAIGESDLKWIMEKGSKAKEGFVIINKIMMSKKLHERFECADAEYVEYENIDENDFIEADSEKKDNEDNPIIDNKDEDESEVISDNEQKEKKYPIPSIIDELYVIDVNEGLWISIVDEPKWDAKKIGQVYGSLTGINVIETVGSFAYIETSNYLSTERINGYIPLSYLKKRKINKANSIIVDLSEQSIYVYKGKEMIREIKCSTGKQHTPTPTGTFLIGYKGEAFGTENYTCYNWVRFNFNYLFHSILFDKDNNIMESEAKKLGERASHGCIRMGYEDSIWFYNTIEQGNLVLIQE